MDGFRITVVSVARVYSSVLLFNRNKMAKLLSKMVCRMFFAVECDKIVGFFFLYFGRR